MQPYWHCLLDWCYHENKYPKVVVFCQMLIDFESSEFWLYPNHQFLLEELSHCSNLLLASLVQPEGML